MARTYEELDRPGIWRNDRFWLAGDHVVHPDVAQVPKIKAMVDVAEKAKKEFKMTEYQGMNYTIVSDLTFIDAPDHAKILPTFEAGVVSPTTSISDVLKYDTDSINPIDAHGICTRTSRTWNARHRIGLAHLLWWSCWMSVYRPRYGRRDDDLGPR